MTRLDTVSGRPPKSGYVVDVVSKGLEIGNYDSATYTRDANNLITSAVFKLNGNTVSTLTFTRNADNRLISKTKS